jgi:hypothetical protein
MQTNFCYINCRNIVEKGRKFSLKILFLLSKFCVLLPYFLSCIHTQFASVEFFSPAGKFSAGTGLKTLVGVGITRGVTEGGVVGGSYSRSGCR